MVLLNTTPIIVGVADLCNRSTKVEDAIEPAELIARAIRSAIADAQIPSAQLMREIDSLSIVRPWTWTYRDLPALVANKLQADPKHRRIPDGHGGNQPALLCDDAARRIARGESNLAVIAGGEALASLTACYKAGRVPPPGWAEQSATGALKVDDVSAMGENIGTAHFIGLPIHVYPLYENGLRAHNRESFQQNTKASAEMYAEFDAIACKHEHSWRYGQKPRDAEAIGTVTQRNRMICTPYPLLMNAFNTVNLAAACVLTSVEHAEHLSIPKDKWVYVLGGAGTSEQEHFWKRRNFCSSQALEQSIDAALKVSDLATSDIDCFDFYSCFPIVPKLACKHIGLDPVSPTKPITLLGGLTSFGGAGNNYSMHAITEMSRQLRKQTVKNGLVLANGGVLTHQHAICLSSKPPKGSLKYPSQNPLPTYVDGATTPRFENQAEGSATIETYTVEYNRDGAPTLGHIVGRLDRDEHRFIANHGDAATLSSLADTTKEPVGLGGVVKKASDGRNLFYIQGTSKL